MIDCITHFSKVHKFHAKIRLERSFFFFCIPHYIKATRLYGPYKMIVPIMDVMYARTSSCFMIMEDPEYRVQNRMIPGH